MASIRTRLTVTYAGALVGALAAFGTALYVARRAAAYQELGHQAIAEADRVLDAIRSHQDASGSDNVADTVAAEATGGPWKTRLSRELSERLERLGGYFLVLDADGRSIFSSFAVRRLHPDDLSRLQEVALRLPAEGDAAARVPLTGDTAVAKRLLIVARTDASVSPAVSRVVAGLPTETADLAPRLLFGTMLVVAPFVLLLSLPLAYYVGGRTFRPVDQLINEVEAITDGRSLHRRLPTDPSNDELSRLTATLNAMIGRLEHSFAALRRFTADASHELKTPLTVLRADVERAMNPSTRSTERMVALEEALQEIARMADLVDSLLTLARADEGRFDLVREPIRLEPVVREVYETATILGEDAGLAVGLPVLEDATVLGDARRLRQLFLNLITNGIKYTPRGGRVEISLSRRPHSGEVAFAVRDTGIGIAAADLPYIFDRFWRADRARSRSSERSGFGLGLAIAQWIAQAHSGSLTVQSRLGRGSVFTVTLPTTDDLAVLDSGAAVGARVAPVRPRRASAEAG
ncbi:MAG: sensor histidine kinase [Gemmatimonadaceae bacterium]